MADLVKIRFTRNDYELIRGCFRVRGDVLDIFPVSSENNLVSIEF